MRGEEAATARYCASRIENCGSRVCLLLGHLLVDVAEAPGLARLGGNHDGMLGVLEVPGRMLVRGGVAAAAMAAGQAGAEVDPVAADLEALFAAVGVGRDEMAVGEVCAEWHEDPFCGKVRGQLF